MRKFARNLRRGRLSIVLGTTALASGLLFPAIAQAQCAPDPTQGGGTTNCNGLDSDGLTVTTQNTQVTVAGGATVQPGAAPAAITITSVGDYLTVNGRVDGTGKPGIAVIAGAPFTAPCDPYAGASVGTCTPGSTVTLHPSASASITVSAGATVTGSQALLLDRDPGNTNGTVTATVYNSGTMTGTAGPAIVSNLSPSNFIGGVGVANTASGFIGGLTGWVTSVDNAGTIAGASSSAIAVTGPSANIQNSGLIQSNGSPATISATQSLSVNNVSGGTIGGSATAISAAGALALTNAGTINGSVISTAPAGQSSTIDTRGGTINGNLTLGAGDDTLRADFDIASGHIYSITGAVDGGAGTDTLAVAVNSNTTFGAVALPTNFELLGLDLVNNATATLSPGFAATGGVAITGYGSVVNQANLTTAGPAVIATTTFAPITFTNQANITATLSNDAQFAVGTPTYLVNNGSITANGGSGAQAATLLTNSGTITASGTAASVLYGSLNNSGTIQSTGGAGATIAYAAYPPSLNSGNISGKTTGVNLTGQMSNSGTITGGDIGVALGYGATLLNSSGGTIVGGTTGVGNAGNQVRVVNAGTIDGNVNLASTSGVDYSTDVFVDAGGTVNGSIALGGGDDQLVVDLAASSSRPFAGAKNGVDAGTGYDTLRYRVNADATAALVLPSSFEGLAYELDNNAVLTLTASTPIVATIGLTGNGRVTLNGEISTTNRTLIDATIPTTDQLTLTGAGTTQALTIINNGTLSMSAGPSFSLAPRSGISAGTSDVINNGTISVGSTAPNYYPVIGIFGGGTVTNTGTITLAGGSTGISSAAYVVNSGTIADTPGSGATGVSSFTTLQNSGVIRVDGVAVQGASNSGGSIINSGTIESREAIAVLLGSGVTLTNSSTGTIRAADAVDITSGGTVINRGSIIGDVSGYSSRYPSAAYFGDGGTVTGNVKFGASGDLFVTSGGTTGVSGTIDGGGGEDAFGSVLTNSGVVSLDGEGNVVNFEDAFVLAQGAGTVVTVNSKNPFMGKYYVSGDGTVINQATVSGPVITGLPFAAGLVLPISSPSVAAFDNRGTINGDVSGLFGKLTNSGTISGAITLGDADDVVENSGTITGQILLRGGNDTFVEHAGGTLGGVVDGGSGSDIFVVDSTGSGSLRASQVINFEQLRQIGSGTVSYSGNFSVGTIALQGGALSVAAGQSLGTTGGTTVTGGDAGVTVTNAGTIAGRVALGAGADRVVNLGTINGPVLLGAGDDTYVEGAGSTALGTVDGGDGTDLYQVMLAGDRTGIGARSNFEQMAVTGTGTLSLALDQDFSSLALAGTGLNLKLGGHVVGPVTGSDAAETLTVDGDLASVSLGGGDDMLALGTTRATGRYDGGAGNDVLRFTANAPIVLDGTVIGFEQVVLTGSGLTVNGTLGAAGDALTFGAGAQNVTIANGGTLAGSIDLGAGDDSFTLASGATFSGSVSGGAGTDTATVEVAGNRTIGTGLRDFERFVLAGGGAVTLTGAQSYGNITTDGDLTVAAGGSLTAGLITFGGGNNRFTIAGQFAGSVDGGGGTDTIAVSGGSETSPTAFGSIVNVESYTQSAGFATVSGTAALGSVDLSGGRLVGLAGSTITAPQIQVRSGATFGSAGTVNGNVAVQGTLSPGASPGTMTVNGNVSLAAGSTSVFELTSGVSDRLVVNGALTVASGAKLQLVPIGTLKPGTSYQLITASGGIDGSFTTVIKPESLFGVLVQRTNTLDLIGQFVDPGTFSAQVSRSIAYANSALIVQPATSGLFATLPSLLTASGAPNAQAFARLTPEPYASATQAAVDDALIVSEATRGSAMEPTGTEARPFAFGQILGGWRHLDGNSQAGTSTTQANGYGFLGGIGFGNAAASFGAFGGYLNDRQHIDALEARTKSDAWLIGLAGRLHSAGGLGVHASVSYQDGTARTDRSLPAAGTASGRYHLRNWVGDAAISYDIPLASGWTVQPKVGVTYVRTTRGGLTEASSSPFALTVASNRHEAVFIDGGLRFGRSDTSEAPFRPFLTVGARYQAEGRATSALAGYSGGGLGLYALGAARADIVGTVAGGVSYRLPSGLDLFLNGSYQTGSGDNKGAVSGGVRFRF